MSVSHGALDSLLFSLGAHNALISGIDTGLRQLSFGFGFEIRHQYHTTDKLSDIYHFPAPDLPGRCFCDEHLLTTMTDDNQPDTTSRSDSEPVSAYTTENEDNNTNSTDDTVFEPEAVAEPEPIEPERPVPEHVLLVALGVLGTLGLLVSTIVPNLI